jgi:hypothetical protein
VELFMLTEFIYHWNPFNLFYGIEVSVEDLICNPLRPTETLRQDPHGHCRRIRAPTLNSSLWERAIFRLQTYLNEKGHLEAIDKIITRFHDQLLQNPPQFTERLQEFNLQADQLLSLKNDYGFVYLKEGDPAFVESRLEQIKEQAYSIFSQYHELRVLEEEEARKKAFMLFQEEIEQRLIQLSFSYQEGVHKTRFLLVASADLLQYLFEERVQSLKNRFKMVQELQKQIDEMELRHKGKFTIIGIEDYFRLLRTRLCNETRKIGVEAESLIYNLLINYHIAPFKEEVKLLLYSIEIDPEDVRMDEITIISFHEELKDEISRIQTIFYQFFNHLI